jgi:three-Cys-motif partner protein
MTASHYDWKHGPAPIQQHSIAKHNILRSYLSAYFQTLVSSPSQDTLRLTLVDGFAGGGLYFHSDTKELIHGSPFICLEATREADYLVNRDRHKKVNFEVGYFFIEPDRDAYLHLDKSLRENGYGSEIGNAIQMRNSKFLEEAGDIIQFIKRKSPKNGRSIFILDQYGYKDVPTGIVQRIFNNLPSAEVILTFGVDSFLNFASDKKLTQLLLEEVGVPKLWQGQRLEEIKKSDRDWRLFIQSTLYKELVSRCGAEYFTPFFIRNQKGHGDYWLIHMSQHHRARDVMTEVHWHNHNYFIHYGGAGLNMFQMVGYDPEHDNKYKGQYDLGFEFDNVAREASIAELMKQIPRLIYAHDDGVSFGELFAKTCNSSPASAAIYRAAVGKLLEEPIVDIVSTSGVHRRSAQQIKFTDQILPPRQRKLFFFGE